MKKIFAFMGLVASAAILFTNCSQNLEIQNAEKTFQIVANTVDTETRTSNDGLSTKWVATDSIGIFHAVSGSTEYGTNDKFVISSEDLTTGKFTGSLSSELTSSTNYDWYALYPYSKYYSTPASTSTGYIYLGSKSVSSAQIQNGNDSQAHLCGPNFPLYGKITGLAAESTPAFSMKQALSVVKVNVTNNSGNPLEIQNVIFTATEPVIGSFYLNIVGEEVAFTASGASYVSNTAKLNVLSGAAIANGASACFYIGLKPFSAKSGETLSLEVNGYKKDLVLTSAANFEAGKIKTLNFNYDKAPVTEPTTKNGYYRVEDASWLKAGDVVAIASTSDNFAMSTTDSGNYRGIIAAEQSADGDYKTIAVSADVQLFTLVEGTKTGTFSFCCVNGTTAGKYIAACSSSSNNMASVSDKTDDASFSISIASGIATVEANGTNTRNSLRYNSGSTRFSCYANTSSMAQVAIFKKYGETGKLQCSAPVANPAAGEITAGSTVALSCSTAGSTIYYTTDGTTPTTSSSVYSSAITVNEAVTIKAIATAEDYDASEVASFAYTIKKADSGIVLDMTTKKFGSTSYSSTLVYDGWTIKNGANSGKGWAYFKMGGKQTTLSSANPCEIWYNSKVTNTISKVTVNIVAGSLNKSGMSVNSWGVFVYSDEAMNTLVDSVAGGTITSAANTFTFEPTKGKTWKDCYVKVSWDLANTTTTNGVICVDNVTIAF